MCNCYYYDRAVHILVAVEMCTLLDRNNFSSSSNGQMAAHRVTGLIIKMLRLLLCRGWGVVAAGGSEMYINIELLTAASRPQAVCTLFQLICDTL